jgi:hypothetical protein
MESLIHITVEFLNIISLSVFVNLLYNLLSDSRKKGLLTSIREFFTIHRKRPAERLSITLRALKLLIPLEKQEHIIGDLLEEFSKYSSRPDAYLWIYKQVFKSVVPLTLNAIKSRFASFFGERIR